MRETCKSCGGSIHWVDDLSAWYHDDPIDILICPAVEVRPVPARG